VKQATGDEQDGGRNKRDKVDGPVEGSARAMVYKQLGDEGERWVKIDKGTAGSLYDCVKVIRRGVEWIVDGQRAQQQLLALDWTEGREVKVRGV
jgi:hypothetical protein